MPIDSHDPDRRRLLLAGAASVLPTAASAAQTDREARLAARLPRWRERLVELTASEAVFLMRSEALDAERYAAALLERAARLRRLNALTNQDAAQVLKDAREADRRRARHGPRRLGALHGLPVLLKDNIDTRQLPTTAATPGLRDNRPQHDAPVAAALFRAGALLFAKATMHELAFGITSNNPTFGAVHNPYDVTKIPGGSSGGTGAAIAARIVPAGLGTDTGGSVRIPGALCGVFGFRPTTGRYPAADIVPISHTRDTAGPLARSVEDLVLFDGVITGAATELPAAVLRGLRLGVPRRYFYENLDPEVDAIMRRTLDALAAAGVDLIEMEVPEVGPLDAASGFPIALYEALRDLPNYLADHGGRVTLAQLAAQMASPDVKGLFALLLSGQPPTIPDAVYLDAVNVQRFRLQAAYRQAFREHDIEAIVFPTTPLPARPVGQDATVELNGRQVPTFDTYIRNTDPGSVPGIPGLQMPAGLTRDRLPVGIELDGPAYSDRRLLAIGLAVQDVLPTLPAPVVRP